MQHGYIPYSVLDLSPIVAGASASDAFRNTMDLARHAEGWGYNRYWMVEQALACSAHGTAESVRRTIAGPIARYQPDEVILNGQIHDHEARLRSFEIAAEVMRSRDPAPGAVSPARR